MRRSHLFLFALLAFVLVMPAHAQFMSQSAATGTAVHPLAVDDVLARVLAFDRDGDGSVAKAELIERMQPLVSRGDVDGNGALDAGEIRALARAPRKALQVQGIHSGTYGFADEEELSSRSHIENTLDDLRLDGATRHRARTVAFQYVDALEKTATADLLTDLQGLLTTEQLTDASATVERQLRGRTGGNAVVRHEVIHFEHAVNGAKVTTRASVFFASHLGGLEGRIASYQLPSPKAEQARAAALRFKTRLRLGPGERSQLVAALKDALDDEERDNFAAAIARRPVVQSAAGFVVAGHDIRALPRVPGGVTSPGQIQLRNSIFFEGKPPVFVR
jgi:hypothetical protein